jgi:hypothetical protein
MTTSSPKPGAGGRSADKGVKRVRLGRMSACLRLLNRAGAATAVQLAQLVYGSVRVSQKHLLRLYQSGLLERLPLADERYGQAEYAYRLSALGHEQLQTGSPPSPGIFLRHTLDIVSTVCALNQSDHREHPPVQLWYAASMTTNILSRFLRPDSIALITTEAGWRTRCRCVAGTAETPLVARARERWYADDSPVSADQGGECDPLPACTQPARQGSGPAARPWRHWGRHLRRGWAMESPGSAYSRSRRGHRIGMRFIDYPVGDYGPSE